VISHFSSFGFFMNLLKIRNTKSSAENGIFLKIEAVLLK
jgi:hypothetical protein